MMQRASRRQWDKPVQRVVEIGVCPEGFGGDWQSPPAHSPGSSLPPALALLSLLAAALTPGKKARPS